MLGEVALTAKPVEPLNLESVTPEASFIDDLGADSLDIVELVMTMEEEFDLEIPDEDAEKIATVLARRAPSRAKELESACKEIDSLLENQQKLNDASTLHALQRITRCH